MQFFSYINNYNMCLNLYSWLFSSISLSVIFIKMIQLKIQIIYSIKLVMFKISKLTWILWYMALTFKGNVHNLNRFIKIKAFNKIFVYNGIRTCHGRKKRVIWPRCPQPDVSTTTTDAKWWPIDTGLKGPKSESDKFNINNFRSMLR